MKGGVAVDWLNLLADGIAATIGTNTADCLDHARVILERLQREHGGEAVYVPVLRREPIDVGAIDADRVRGMSLDRACHRAGTSRRTYYRLKKAGQWKEENHER